MSQRTQYACDLCGEDVAQEDLRSFYSPSVTQRVDVCVPCTRTRKISELVDRYAELFPSKPVARDSA